jgi:hypothetical protein
MENNNKELNGVKKMIADRIVTQEAAEKYFPELKESEDEKILRVLKEGFEIYNKGEWYGGITNEQILAWLEKQGEQKPAWSKEDEDYYDAIIAKLEVTQEDAALTDNQMNFLKFLKDRVKPKQEWSEEDENILRTIISDVIRGAEIDMLQINWLKAIKKRVACEAKCTTKKEWSKEVEIWIDRACMLLDELNHLSTLTLAKIPSNVNDIISHLKSLKDRIGG